MEDSKKIYSVSEVNYFAKQTLEQLTLWVEGEISSIQEKEKWFNSFITIKDEENTLPCFIEKKLFQKFKNLKIGDNVEVYGILTLFRKTEYKLKIFQIKQSGEGILQKQFEELYIKLKTEGLFDPKNKKEIPIYPKKVCIVSSHNSAAWNDFKTHTSDKFKLIELTTADVPVEGTQAINKLTRTLKEVDKKSYDVVVVTRGGGSQESLMEVYNHEKIAQVIFKMKTPTIAAIGHEINITLAELAADKRASTPTDAANLVTHGYTKALESLDNNLLRLKSQARTLFADAAELLDSIFTKFLSVKSSFKDLPYKLSGLEKSLKNFEKELVKDAGNNLETLGSQIKKNINILVIKKNQQLFNLEKSLNLLSPKNTLKRGYSITHDAQGNIITNANHIVLGSKIGVRLAKGRITGNVVEKFNE